MKLTVCVVVISVLLSQALCMPLRKILAKDDNDQVRMYVHCIICIESCNHLVTYIYVTGPAKINHVSTNYT